MIDPGEIVTYGTASGRTNPRRANRLDTAGRRERYSPLSAPLTNAARRSDADP